MNPRATLSAALRKVEGLEPAGVRTHLETLEPPLLDAIASAAAAEVPPPPPFAAIAVAAADRWNPAEWS